ncbi:hypothetical protein ACSVDE_10960 [Pseudalkalibacillus sp. Hm43]|uniref:hypothetical protein n=1 Tax=Pseudalkalibacillus sp. Hm43 TaxID=3450742 RepID=UPI003F42D90E
MPEYEYDDLISEHGNKFLYNCIIKSIQGPIFNICVVYNCDDGKILNVSIGSHCGAKESVELFDNDNLEVVLIKEYALKRFRSWFKINKVKMIIK